MDYMNSVFRKLTGQNLLFHLKYNFLIVPTRKIRRLKVRFSYAYSRYLDSRRTIVPRRLLIEIQAGSMGYEYRGIPCAKNPFDLAIYLKLLWDLKPRTIVEIGSAAGGSGQFFSDQSALFGLGTMVYSFDINRVKGMDSENLKFLHGDVHDLASSALPAILGTIDGPLLVVEDGPHTYEGCQAALRFFHPHLKPGDHIVVEDGNLRDLGYLNYEDGVNRAVREFLNSHPEDYEIRFDLCDTFGQNVTWNTDGYLKRL